MTMTRTNMICSEHPISKLIGELSAMGLSYQAIKRFVYQEEKVRISDCQIAYHSHRNGFSGVMGYRNGESSYVKQLAKMTLKEYRARYRGA